MNHDDLYALFEVGLRINSSPWHCTEYCQESNWPDDLASAIRVAMPKILVGNGTGGNNLLGKRQSHLMGIILAYLHPHDINAYASRLSAEDLVEDQAAFSNLSVHGIVPSEPEIGSPASSLTSILSEKVISVEQSDNTREAPSRVGSMNVEASKPVSSTPKDFSLSHSVTREVPQPGSTTLLSRHSTEWFPPPFVGSTSLALPALPQMHEGRTTEASTAHRKAVTPTMWGTPLAGSQPLSSSSGIDPTPSRRTPVQSIFRSPESSPRTAWRMLSPDISHVGQGRRMPGQEVGGNESRRIPYSTPTTSSRSISPTQPFPKRRDTGKQVARSPLGSPSILPAYGEASTTVQWPIGKSVYSSSKVNAANLWHSTARTLVAKSTFGSRSASPSNDDDLKGAKYGNRYDLRDEALASTIQEALVQLGLKPSSTLLEADRLAGPVIMTSLREGLDFVPCSPYGLTPDDHLTETR